MAEPSRIMVCDVLCLLLEAVSNRASISSQINSLSSYRTTVSIIATINKCHNLHEQSESQTYRTFTAAESFNSRVIHRSRIASSKILESNIRLTSKPASLKQGCTSTLRTRTSDLILTDLVQTSTSYFTLIRNSSNRSMIDMNQHPPRDKAVSWCHLSNVNFQCFSFTLKSFQLSVSSIPCRSVAGYCSVSQTRDRLLLE
mmetsp:Transcript_39714/g.95934  ORF Transcript_39714/g.95934 Transcript_39714/m.95934 type:complete len:200 (+) Transcript_39714:516-1115(+)